METFNVQISTQPQNILVTVSGYVNEHSQFPKLPEAETVIIDLGGVKGLNSVGTRSWCTWLKTIRPSSKISLENCPVIFVKSFNQVKGSYPDNAQAASFLVPYYSDATDERKDVLFKHREHFGSEKGIVLPQVLDSQGTPMEIDVIEDVYFAFLERV